MHRSAIAAATRRPARSTHVHARAWIVALALVFGLPQAIVAQDQAPAASPTASSGPAKTRRPTRASSARYVDANADRVLLSPTAETQPAGTLFLSLHEGLPQLGYAVSNRTQVALSGLGAPQAGFLDISVKSNMVRRRHIRVSVGAAIDYAGAQDFSFAFGRASSTLQLCFRASCLSSVSVGGTIILHSAPSVALPYGISLGLTTYVSDAVTLLLEYTSLMNASDDLFFLDFPIFLVSYGVRLRANPRWALDISMVQSLSNSQPTIGRERAVFEVLGFPFIAYTYRWGPAY